MDIQPQERREPSYGQIRILDAVREAVALTREHLITLVAALIIALAVSIFTGGFLVAALMLAMSGLCLRIVDREDGLQSKDIMLKIKDLVVPAFLLMILPLIGVAACVGGIVVMIPVTIFATFLRADHPELSEAALLKESWRAISDAGLFKWLFMQVVLIPLIASVGFLGCGIGMFATTAFAIMINACAYRQVCPRSKRPPAE